MKTWRWVLVIVGTCFICLGFGVLLLGPVCCEVSWPLIFCGSLINYLCTLRLTGLLKIGPPDERDGINALRVAALAGMLTLLGAMILGVLSFVNVKLPPTKRCIEIILLVYWGSSTIGYLLSWFTDRLWLASNYEN
jgi:hypothetical protein